MYLQSTERIIEEERPRAIQAASSSQNNVNNLAVPAYAPFDPAENEVVNKDNYFTHIQGNFS